MSWLNKKNEALRQLRQMTLPISAVAILDSRIPITIISNNSAEKHLKKVDVLLHCKYCTSSEYGVALTFDIYNKYVAKLTSKLKI